MSDKILLYRIMCTGCGNYAYSTDSQLLRKIRHDRGCSVYVRAQLNASVERCQRCERVISLDWLPPDGVDYCTCAVIDHLRGLAEIDKQVEAEIETIKVEPINPADYKPEDWLPTPEELERLLEEE